MVFVTGGTGYLGRRVLSQLQQRNIEVTALYHDAVPDVSGIRWVRGDVRDAAGMAAAMQGADVVLHLVGVIREVGDATFAAMNVEACAKVAAATKRAGVRRLVYCSAQGAIDDPRYRYARSKWQGEQAVQQSGVPFTILRPCVLFGPGGGFVDRLLQSIAMSPPGMVVLPGGGRARFSPFAADDAARCLVQAALDDSFQGKVLEVGGPEQLSYADMMRQLMAVRGERRVELPLPLWLLRGIVPGMGLVLKDPPVTPTELRQLDFDNVVPPDAVQQQFGFAPQRFRDGIAYVGRQTG